LDGQQHTPLYLRATLGHFTAAERKKSTQDGLFRRESEERRLKDENLLLVCAII
jgi:hypothetical protein